MELGEAIRRARGRVGQVDLATRMGDDKIDQSRISKWERGIGAPSLDQMRAMEDALGILRGTILRLAGYVDDVNSLREAIETDPVLNEYDKINLLDLYDAMVSRRR